MFKSNDLACVALAAALVLVGCGSDSSDPPYSFLGSGTPAELEQIKGLWGDEADDDIGYLYIDDTGAMLFYDYQADAAGSGENCYILSDLSNENIKSSKVVPNGNDFDMIQDLQLDGYTSVLDKVLSLSEDQNSLMFWEIDQSRKHFSADGLTYTQPRNEYVAPTEIPRLVGVDPLDLTICED